jgi:hypothetical protein
VCSGTWKGIGTSRKIVILPGRGELEVLDWGRRGESST